MSRWFGVLGLASLVGAFGGACGPSRVKTGTAPGAKALVSNVLRMDYAGSAACAPCHADLHDSWMKSPMHRMTRLLPEAAITAPFDGRALEFKGDKATLQTLAGKRYVRIVSSYGKAPKDRLYQVTKVIGGRIREDFAGIEVDLDSHAIVGTADKILPISYMRRTGALRYKGYSVMEHERPALAANGDWRARCIFCHNTAPYLDVMLQGFAGFASPPYQGALVDALLPAARRSTFTVTDPEAFGSALHAEVRAIDAPAGVHVARGKTVADQVGRAIDGIRARVGEQHLVEVGLGCEVCHLGSRAHTEAPAIKPSFVPTHPSFTVKAPAGDPKAQAINRACARCHQVLFSGYPHTWEGGLRNKEPGGSHINSGEARDFLLGGCTTALACTACHDPHVGDDRARLTKLEGVAGDAVCTRCHGKYAGAAALAHTHHPEGSTGARCFGCHLPKKNMALDGGLTRYHRIGRPNDPVRVLRDRPLECALCHVDKSPRFLVETMESWWGGKFDRAELKALYGDLEGDVLLATLSLGKPHEQAVAAVLVGEKKRRSAVPFLLPVLVSPFPLVRYFALDALEAILGGPSGVDLHQTNAAIAKQAHGWVLGKGFTLAP
ncbi:MAG: hypothetical protein JNL79_24080 [Myxococcales bacterium]|nr:hypothetical protein [Myxococcales bacterium]